MSASALTLFMSVCAATGMVSSRSIDAFSSSVFPDTYKEFIGGTASGEVFDLIDYEAVKKQIDGLSEREKIAAFRIRLDEYKSLREGWDGDAGIAPLPSLVDDLSALFEEVVSSELSIPDPAISSDGEVGIYWRKDGFFAEITIDGAGEYSYFAKTADGKRYFAEELEVAAGIDQELLSLVEVLSSKRVRRLASARNQAPVRDSYFDEKVFSGRSVGSSCGGNLFQSMGMRSSAAACQ